MAHVLLAGVHRQRGEGMVQECVVLRGDLVNEASLFTGALEHSPGPDRLAYLAEVCGGDSALRQRLDELLAAHQHEVGPLEHLPNSADLTLDSGRPGRAAGSPVAVGTVIADRYRLLELIGEGGMGDVYVAEQFTPVRRKVALKLIKSGLDSRGVLARFEQERQALAVMDHPHIAKVFDGGVTQSGRPYFVMEYIKGVPITEYCDLVRMPIRQRLELFAAACHAVQHAHQKGIIHRDLKPSNILVALYDDKPVTKVIDFGLAKTVDRPLTENLLHTGHAVVMGTPLYMSPEQAKLNNLDIDTRSDVYALGVVLYELLTGSTPIDRERFQKAAWDEALRLVREEDPPTPSTRLSSADGLPNLAALRQQEPARLPRMVQGELDWIVMKALEKDRSRRYETASSLAADISNYLNDDPVVACPPSAVYRLRKFARRNKLAFFTAGTVAASLLLGLVGTSWQAIRAMRAEAAAIAERDEKESARREAIASTETATTQRRVAETAADNERQAKLAAIEARQDAENAGQFARAESAKFELINQFLTQDLLSQAEPENSAVEDHITLLEVLDRAAAKVAQRYFESPELEIELRRVIARTYHSLGSYAKAQQQWQVIEERARASLGDTDPVVWFALKEQGHMLFHFGRYDEAIAVQEKCLQALRQTAGPDHVYTHSAMRTLAMTYENAGNYNRALLLLEPLYQAEQNGDDSAARHDTLFHLASTYLNVGQCPRGLALAEKLLDLCRTTLGPEHPHTIGALYLLAMAHEKSGRPHEAIAVAEPALAAARRVLGLDHPQTINVLVVLARSHGDIGRFAEAISMREQILEVQRKIFGPEHPKAIDCLSRLVDLHRDAEQFDRCAPLAEELVKWLRMRHGSEHDSVLITLSNAATYYSLAGRCEIAERLSREAVEVTRRVKGIDHPMTLQSLSALAEIHWRNGKSNDAIPLGVEVLASSRRTRDEVHQDTLEAACLLAKYNSYAGRMTEAGAVIDEWLPRVKASLDSSNRVWRLGHEVASEIHERSGAPELAEPYRRAVVDAWQETPGDNAVKAAVARAWLGYNLLLQARPADAEPILETALATQAEQAAERWGVFNSRSLLGEALLGQHKLAQAAPLLLAGYNGLKERESRIPRELRFQVMSDALSRMIRLYEATGNPDEAAKWRRELDMLEAAAAEPKADSP